MLLAGGRAEAHACCVAHDATAASEASSPAERARRAKHLRRENVPAISSAMHTAALLTRVHVTIHSSTRRLAKLLHIGKSRAHAICNPEKPESITLADLLALGLAGSDEPRAIAVGILRDVAEYIGAHDEIVREHRDAADDSQLSLFSEDV